MKQQYPSTRRIKKALRSLEQDLGNTLKHAEFDFSDEESKGKLDFWVSYYITWLLRKTALPSHVWCDGILWQNNNYKLEFTKVRENQFELKCKLDILEYKDSFSSNLFATFEYDNNFKKFIKFSFQLNIGEERYVFSS